MIQLVMVLVAAVLVYKLISFFTFRLLPRLITLAVLSLIAVRILGELAPVVYTALPMAR